jgi:hypothetical protein
MANSALRGIAFVAQAESLAPLRALSQWCVYRPELDPKTGRVDKIPLTPATLRRAKTNDARTWGTFDAACGAVARLGGRGYGCGFVLTLSDPFFAIDLDDVVDPSTGSVSSFARETLTALACYAETSPSGRGLHLLGCGQLPSGRRKTTVDGTTVEAYDALRFISISGTPYGDYVLPIVPNDGADVAALQAALDTWYARTFGTDASEAQSAAENPRSPAPVPDAADDEALLDRVFRNRRGDRVRRLWEGGPPEGDGVDTSASGGDFALCCELAFWTHGNAAWIDRLFRASRRMRDKWNERRGAHTYGELTIARAVTAYVRRHNANPDPDDPDPIPEDPMTPKDHDAEFLRTRSTASRRPNGEAAALETPSAVGAGMLPFPVEIFPDTIAAYARAVARTMPCPIDFVGLPIMTIAGSLIGATREIAPKPAWRERPLLYSALVAAAGDKKTPALDAVGRPLYREATSFLRDFTARMEFYERALLVYEADLNAWKRARANPRSAAAAASDPPHKPERPLCRRVEASDTTVEALALLLSENPRGIVLAHDELTGWVRGLNQYKGGHGNDREFFLRCWSGGAITIDRKVLRQSIPQGYLHLPHPALAVLGGLIPGTLGLLADERGLEDGFIHRIVFAFPDPVADGWIEDSVPEHLETAWADVVRALIDLRYTEHLSDDGTVSLAPIVRVLSADAKAGWVAFQAAHHAEIDAVNFDPALRGPWRKLESVALRAALILNEMRRASGENIAAEISPADLAGAQRFVDWAKSHVRKVYRYFSSTPADHKALRAVAWIRKRGGKVTLRDVLRNEVCGVKKTSEASQLFKDLQDRGWGTMNGRRPVTFTLVSGRDPETAS